MLVRTLAALALVPLLLFLIYGGMPLYVMEFIIVIIGLNEFYKAFKLKDIRCIESIGYIFTIYILFKNVFRLPIEYTLLFSFALFLIGAIFMMYNKFNIVEFAITYLGIIYISLFLDHIILTVDNFELGKIYVWLIFILAFMTDTCAYFAGYFFGKHKLIPQVSPKKTIEGSIGGIIGSTISCIVFGYLFNLNLVHMIVIGSIGSVVAQVGDLFASSIKRYIGIKDYGKLIPGHGGILDRFDSVIFTAPFVYYALKLFIQ
ncbi:MAG TPA: phosphatidate cytidylyltransferase [Peptostreptococcaceae bacterium]|nr:phosphatidate cytidylyltransferase [Peptostreptococcaceae bacterium]